MHYKTQSLITISIVLGIMIAVAVVINSVDTEVTGSTIKCACENDADCDDNNPCTEDICLYPESCAASKCIHKNIENCR